MLKKVYHASQQTWARSHKNVDNLPVIYTLLEHANGW